LAIPSASKPVFSRGYCLPYFSYFFGRKSTFFYQNPGASNPEKDQGLVQDRWGGFIPVGGQQNGGLL